MFRPHRLRRFLHTVGAVSRRDPTLFVFGFSLWALCNGASLLASSDAFTRAAIYSVAADLANTLAIPNPDNFVGTGMVVDGLLLAWVCGERSYSTRAAVLWGSGIVWMFWAFILFFGGLRGGLYSSAAVWTFLASGAIMGASANRWDAPAGKVG